MLDRKIMLDRKKTNTKAPKFVFDSYFVYVKLKVARKHLVWTSKAVEQVP